MESDHHQSNLTAIVSGELDRDVSAAARAMTDALIARHGNVVSAVLYYGSCFRNQNEEDGILDIFVIVDDYVGTYGRGALATANYLLPPNVFYFELEHGSTTLRTKYAVMSMRQFIHRTSARCFHTFFWARFAQPCVMTYARDQQSRDLIARAVATAVETFVRRMKPLMNDRYSAAELWTCGLAASYGTELRPESHDAAQRLVTANAERYNTITQCLANAGKLRGCEESSVGDVRYEPDTRDFARIWARTLWKVRPVQGKLINLLRIMKAAFTFDGGVDYVLWKIERHTGIKVEATPMLRRYPLIACWPTVWRLYRAGAFR